MALYRVHEEIVQEMSAGGYNYKSTLDKKLAKGKGHQDEFIDPVERQIEILRGKGCDCEVIRCRQFS